MTDPRIHARRVAIARERGRRRRRRLLAAVVVLALAAGGFALVHSSVFGARHIRVVGAPDIPSSRVISTAGLEGAPPLVDLSARSIAARVERLPFVLTAAVHIAWPSTVSIDVVERIPVAAVRTAGGTYAVCDTSGRVLEVVPARPSSLPLVAPVGNGVAPAVAGRSLPGADRSELEAAGAMPESLVSSVSEVADGPNGVVVNLRDGIVAIIGPGSDLPAKYVALATVLAHGGLAGVAAIDLRVATAPVLVPRGRS